MTSSAHPKVPQDPPAKLTLLYVLFFVSGFPALIYQIVWERALFTFYGVNIESVTIIVTAFMLGLGLGSLAGGRISRISNLPIPVVFGGIEIGIGLFGAMSLVVFHRVALLTVGASTIQTGLISFCLVLLPTVLMGATLPLLTTHIVRVTRNVGASVGVLYAVNTFGSATACVLAAFFVMRYLGESGSVRLAASLNLLVGCLAVVTASRAAANAPSPALPAEPEASRSAAPATRFPLGLVLSAIAGFISLGYEIVWYRLYSYVSGGIAPSFAFLLGAYLAGIAFGSLVVGDFSRQSLRDHPERALDACGNLIIWSGIVSFLVGPAMAAAVMFVPYIATFPLVFVGSCLLGAVFPLLSHYAIAATNQTGTRLSYLYLANIVGSASGSFAVGFVLMDFWSIRTVSLFLLALAVAAAALLLPRGGWRTRVVTLTGIAATVALTLLSPPLFAGLYERMLYKRQIPPESRFHDLIETRSGVIATSPDGTVFGGGVYDGRFNTDLMHDSNGIFRAFAIGSIHPHPSEVLMIGLSSGSWAQVIANHPDVDHLTIIEINPGYLDLIPRYSQVASVLHNPKVQIRIDDGRRWLLRNPNSKFDLIVMNTTYNWRANASNILSVEFLNLVRGHLKPGGIAFYNTTSSGEALLTGATVFPQALLVWNVLAVSDSPMRLDKRKWEEQLSRYTIDGKPVLDLADATQRGKLDQVVSLADTLDSKDPSLEMILESGQSLRRRLQGYSLITDDNMGTEWSGPNKGNAAAGK